MCAHSAHGKLSAIVPGGVSRVLRGMKRLRGQYVFWQRGGSALRTSAELERHHPGSQQIIIGRLGQQTRGVCTAWQ